MQERKLYKIDIKGKVRVWWIEYDSEKYRTHSGILDGKIVTSGWQYPEQKNVGRSNETSVEEQVICEVDAEYTKKLNQGKYHPTLDETSNGAKFIECMLATKYDPNKHNKFPYLSQPKLDGIRCLISKDGMQSRNGKPIISAPHIFEELKPFFDEYPHVVLDGELYNHNIEKYETMDIEEGTIYFEKIVSLVRKTKPTDADLEESKRLVQYHIYDCICGNDPQGKPYDMMARHQFLADEFPSLYEVKSDFPIIHVTTTIVYNNEELDSTLSSYLKFGYEGQILRVPDSPYENKRSKNLIKHKEFEDDEFEIVNIEEGEGNWASYAKAVKIRLKDGTTQSSGMRGNQKFTKQILADREKLIGTDVTVRYQNKTADGKLRFPVAIKFWYGKREL